MGKADSLLGLDRLSIGKKLMVLVALFMAVVSAMVGYTIVTLDAQKSDGALVNIAGRQRMLTQKFTKEFFLALHHAQQHNTPVNRERLEKTQKLFDLSLAALANGGQTYLDLGMEKPLQLPGTKTQEIAQKLDQVNTLWQQLQQEIVQASAGELSSNRLDQINSLSGKVLGTMNQAVVMLANESDQKVRSMVSNQIWIWSFAMIAGILIGGVIGKNITKPLHQAVGITRRISEGDLKSYPTHKPQRDELGALLGHVDRMRSELSAIIHTVQQNSRQMSLSSYQIATISKAIHDTSASEQLGSQRVLEATDSLRGIVATVSDSIERAKENANETKNLGEQGIAVVNESITELAGSVEGVNQTAARLESLKSATEKINTIIESIDTIAEQTNLLALNAAIEAARAGDHGRGFAVVAGEVRTLASRTAESTTEITALISDLTSKVDASVNSMQEVVRQVHKSREKSQETVSVFDSIMDGISTNTENTAHIAECNIEQTEKLKLFQGELKQLFDVLNRNGEMAIQTTSVADNLHSVSKELDELLQRFKTDAIDSPERKPSENRCCPRIRNSVTVDLIQGDRRIEGLTEDLSLRGIKVRSAKPLNSSQPLTVNVHVPSGEKPGDQEFLSVDCHIVHTNSKGDLHQYGIDFGTLSPVEREKLEKVFRYFKKPHSYSSVAATVA
ncbi:MAG: type IV pili methyl-accepting chemotaxis transducer N-terminal domain-containing protein [Gammaproteobacteria bacterium]|nr:type IV pili methyl-accepting chemotaxis transducer N-terminal domain-containing protein [Gammaproteobacteria bacterium]